MQVLLLLKDLYLTKGGGQAVYQKIIEQNPEILFYYFLEREQMELVRPTNTSPINFSRSLKRNQLIIEGNTIDDSNIDYLINCAVSIENMDFDIIEFPDFMVFGPYFKVVFAHFNVKVKSFVLSLHGRTALSNHLNWDKNNGSCELALTPNELEQFKLVDYVYGISSKYIEFYRKFFEREVYHLDPYFLVNPHPLNKFESPTEFIPDLYCIGRTERIKGQDIFLELIRNLNSKNFNSVYIAGEEDFSNFGISSIDILEDYAERRDLSFTYLSELDKADLKKIYNGNSIVILPVRNDTFNLVAFEAIFSGCLVAISNRAGICDYLDSNYPGLPYLKFDIKDLFNAAADINEFIENRAKIRSELNDYLLNLPIKSLDVNIYDQFLKSRFNQRVLGNSIGSINSIVIKKVGFNYKFILFKLLTFFIKNRGLNIMLSARKGTSNFIKYHLRKSKLLGFSNRIHDLLDSYLVILNGGLLGTKLTGITNTVYNNRYFRYSYWGELYNYFVKSSHIHAAVYGIRIFRSTNKREYSLQSISDILIANNFEQEAEVLFKMYHSEHDSSESVYEYLNSRFIKNKSPKIKNLEIIDDFRLGLNPKVSLIVSMYNAESKLNSFLSAISKQTLFQNSELYEIILVDSCSPSNEFGVFQEFSKSHKLNIVYAKSAHRETIQSAWNSGIKISCGEYLVFLGVDESLYPDALEILANELNENKEIDWVMSNSFVNEITSDGEHLYDSLFYNRANSNKEHVYLDTCYISWVGGMYRKSIHDRFGYYDESFKAAGDTEFKNRILKFLNVKFVNKTLGIFLNYPEERATSSYLAEIEDLRAWYIYKTPGGIKYLFENYSLEKIEKVFYESLTFRRSFSVDYSTDFSYAICLGNYIVENFQVSSQIKLIVKDLKYLSNILEKINLIEPRNSFKVSLLFYPVYIFILSYYFNLKHKFILQFKHPIQYRIFNDVKYLQHFWIWK